MTVWHGEFVGAFFIGMVNGTFFCCVVVGGEFLVVALFFSR